MTGDQKGKMYSFVGQWRKRSRLEDQGHKGEDGELTLNSPVRETNLVTTHWRKTSNVLPFKLPISKGFVRMIHLDTKTQRKPCPVVELAAGRKSIGSR